MGAEVSSFRFKNSTVFALHKCQSLEHIGLHIMLSLHGCKIYNLLIGLASSFSKHTNRKDIHFNVAN